MRILFTGHTGINKDTVLQRLALAIAAERGVPPDLDNVNTRKVVRVYCLEDFIYTRTGLRGYLESKDAAWLEDQWRAAAQDLSDVLDRDPAEFELISFHCTFQRGGVITCPVDVEILLAMKPWKLVTLIDDVYDTWRRIQIRDELNETNFLIRLKEMANWRWVEILTTDLLTRFLSSQGEPVENLVLAVKHRVDTARRLVLESQSKRVYAACSITEPRKTDEGRKAIDEYRREMAERYASFDPLSIDEKLVPLFSRAREARGRDEVVVLLQEDDRWLIDREDILTGPEEGLYPITLPVDEVLEVETEISRQIEARDFRLIRQSECMAAFRPMFEGEPSQGVISELKYARDGAHRATFIYSPLADGIHQSPFATEQIRYEDLEPFYRAIDQELSND